jgi:hypothetical protein
LFILFIESAPHSGLDGRDIVIVFADHHGHFGFHLAEWTMSEEWLFDFSTEKRSRLTRFIGDFKRGSKMPVTICKLSPVRATGSRKHP